MEQQQFDRLIQLPPVKEYNESEKLDFATEPDISFLR